jgi:hypothetical protein
MLFAAASRSPGERANPRANDGQQITPAGNGQRRSRRQQARSASSDPRSATSRASLIRKRSLVQSQYRPQIYQAKLHTIAIFGTPAQGDYRPPERRIEPRQRFEQISRGDCLAHPGYPTAPRAPLRAPADSDLAAPSSRTPAVPRTVLAWAVMLELNRSKWRRRPCLSTAQQFRGTKTSMCSTSKINC